ncbi:hypothetical protein [Geomobilimonas luticola]|uniref:Spore coat protein U domain-containing protein n=1 Tax=Geomobilimonas luticola TaxID=1114878 RepID=A0ABS5SD36_9BACT|nr:hypothetical protein [Geomobilimonas luticola]MBT0653280.1 hypothetical protein [Geomobilimonas luticola]
MNVVARLLTITVLAGVLASATVAPGLAASASAGLNISLVIASSANLMLSTTSLTFLADDPAIQPSVPASENPVSVLAKVRTKGAPSLYVLSSDDLRSGADVIPITNLTWTADGTPFTGGTMNKTTPQLAATLPTGSGSYQSAYRYFLSNSALYLPGTYSTTINYTLTAP